MKAQIISSILKLAGTAAAVVGFAAGAVGTHPQEFIGHWSGKGTYIFAGDLTQCAQMEMVFTATEASFTFDSGSRVCDKHSETFYKVTMRYQDGKFYFGNEVVGTYDGQVMTLAYRAPDGDTFRNWRMSMRREGNHLMYEESRIMDGQETPLISFAGMLIKQEGE